MAKRWIYSAFITASRWLVHAFFTVPGKIFECLLDFGYQLDVGLFLNHVQQIVIHEITIEGIRRPEGLGLAKS